MLFYQIKRLQMWCSLLGLKVLISMSSQICWVQTYFLHFWRDQKWFLWGVKVKGKEELASDRLRIHRHRTTLEYFQIVLYWLYLWFDRWGFECHLLLRFEIQEGRNEARVFKFECFQSSFDRSFKWWAQNATSLVYANCLEHLIYLWIIVNFKFKRLKCWLMCHTLFYHQLS